MTERRYGLGGGLLGRRALQQVSDALEIEATPDAIGLYEAAVELAITHDLDVWPVYDELRRMYGDEDIPTHNLEVLLEDLERQVADYEVHEEEVETALALVRPEGFRVETDEDGSLLYSTEIVVPTRSDLLVSHEEWLDRTGPGLGFHYDPYGFDSLPERDFYLKALEIVVLNPDEVEDIYFTGGITDPAKTDFWVEYQDEKGKWRRYTPDFVIRKRPEDGGPPGSGKILIVEVKAAQFASEPKMAAARRLESLNPERLRYEIIFTSEPEVSGDDMRVVREFVGLRDDPEAKYLRIPVDRDAIMEFCRRWRIDDLSFFGSVLTDDFGPESDVDVLVSFDPNAEWSLFDISRMEEELTRILGREAEIVERSAVESSHNWIRKRDILEGAEPYLVKG